MTESNLYILISFLDRHVRPMYFSLDRGHDEYHYDEVVKTTIKLSYFYNITDTDLISLIIAAAYHDTGRLVEDKGHENLSAKIFKRDLFLKDFLNESFPNIKYKVVVRKASKIIRNHRASVKTKDELSLILKDADKISHLSKERGLYRPISYYLDRNYRNETKAEIVSNRINYFKGDKISYTPKSKAMKHILGKEDEISIMITPNDILNTVNKILSENNNERNRTTQN